MAHLILPRAEDRPELRELRNQRAEANGDRSELRNRHSILKRRRPIDMYIYIHVYISTIKTISSYLLETSVPPLPWKLNRALCLWASLGEDVKNLETCMYNPHNIWGIWDITIIYPKPYSIYLRGTIGGFGFGCLRSVVK